VGSPLALVIIARYAEVPAEVAVFRVGPVTERGDFPRRNRLHCGIF
jgi:hypothetical protein